MTVGEQSMGFGSSARSPSGHFSPVKSKPPMTFAVGKTLGSIVRFRASVVLVP